MCFNTFMTFKTAVRRAGLVLAFMLGAVSSSAVLAQGVPLAGTATASTQAAASRSAQMANDGNANTRWEASNSSPGSWLRISFADAKAVSAVSLREYGNRISEYRIEYLSGNTWAPMIAGTTIGTIRSHAFPIVITTTAVRILILRASSQPSLVEFGVFGGVEELGYYPGCKMPPATQTIMLTSTLVVGPGEVFDGGNARYNIAGGGESSPPVFQVNEGGTVRNVIIGQLASDGIHCLGNCTLNNVWWENVAEDAATALGPVGTVMTVDCGAAYQSPDKIFQHNGRGEVRISRFYGSDGGRLYRSCGDCTNNGGPRRVSIENVITRNLSTTVAINSNYGDVATIRNLVLDNTNSTPTNVCRVYKGVQKGASPSTLLGVEWNTPNCNVSPSDVTLRGPSQIAPATCTGSCPQ